MNIKNWHGCCSSLRQYQFVARYPHGGGVRSGWPPLLLEGLRHVRAGTGV